MSCGVACRRGSDPALLWLWRRPVATAPIQPLAWEPPYAAGAAQEMAKRQKTKNKQTNKKGVPVVAQWLTNPTRNHEVAGWSLPLLSGLTIRRCRELWCCRDLWCRLQTRLGSRVAVALA